MLLGISFLLGVTSYAGEPTSEQYKEILEVSNEFGIENAVALAIADIESSFDAGAIGKCGELGIFQLHPKFHSDYSISSAMAYLSTVKRSCEKKYGNAWIVCYNTGQYALLNRNPKETVYYKKFSKAYRKWKQYGQLH